MNKTQLLLIIGSILLAVLLFAFGSRRAPISKQDAQSVKAAPAATIDFGHLVRNLKENKLSPTQKDSAELIESKLSDALTPQNALVYQELAQFWEKTGYLEVAAHYYQQRATADSTENNWTIASNKLLDAFRISGDSTMHQYLLDKAIHAHNRTIAFDTSKLEPKIGLATCYIEGDPSNQRGQLMQGVLMLVGITKKDSLNIPANLLLGEWGIISNQYDKAENRLNIVTTHDPENPKGHYFLAQLYLLQDKKEKAKEALKECKKWTKNPTFADELEKIIQNI